MAPSIVPPMTRRSLLASITNFSIRRLAHFSIQNMPKSSLASPGPVLWILDWDGTITRHDTLNALVHISAKTNPNAPISENWTRVSEAYLLDYKAALQTLAPNGTLPATVDGEKKLLKALEKVEQKSIDRVSESKIFEGLTRKRLDQGTKQAIEVKEVEIREGYPELMRYVQSRMYQQGESNDAFNILSVNWSRRFIAGCLRASDIDLEGNLIYANELDGIDAERSSSGRICPEGDLKIISSGNKQEILNKLRTTDAGSGKAVPIIYIGDSWTDFEALLAADLGICIRDDPITSSQRKLAEAFQRLQIKCPHIKCWKQTDENNIVWAMNFTEIEQWVRNIKAEKGGIE